MTNQEAFKKAMEGKQRVVVKVGSSTLTHPSGDLNLARIERLAWELVNMKNNGIEVTLVSSGAIACGSKRLNIANIRELPVDSAAKQAAAAVGQVILMQLYQRVFSEYGYHAAQILLTNVVEHSEDVRQHAINTFDELQHLNVIPVVNENDTISVEEIEFGDNDKLSAIIAKLVDADLLILLSDVDGLYTADPSKDPTATRIDCVDCIDQVRKMAGQSQSKVGTGGMVTKLKAAEMANADGIDVVIANGEDMRVISQIMDGQAVGTWFKGVKNE